MADEVQKRGQIFLLSDDGLIGMTEQQYDSEDLLQTLLADYPDLMAGDQINSLEPRRWLPIAREMSIPDDTYLGGRWSLDHLFLDQDGIPTLVEVKRSTDTRIRREVVGQMLDYAANAATYWQVERIRAQFELKCEQLQIAPDSELEGSLGITDSESFWQQVATNLSAGRLRLVFVADEIPLELRRIIEFLNRQMQPAEVLGLEIKQYVGEGSKTLVPTVIGQTAETQQKKTGSQSVKRQWDATSFFTKLGQNSGEAEVSTARRILAWAESRGLRVWWGYGQQQGSFFPVFDYDGLMHRTVSIWTNNAIEVQFQYMVGLPVFNDEAKRIELLQRLNAVPGINLPTDGIARRPSFSLSVLDSDKKLNAFLNALDWFLEEIKVHYGLG